MDQTNRSSLACDACRRRKVKCNGIQGCSQCVHLGLKCQYSKRSPCSRSRKSIARGHVIEACKVENVRAPPQPLGTTSVGGSIKSKEQSAETEPSFSASDFYDLVPDYTSFVMPALPIISATEFSAMIAEMETDRVAKALVYALGALTIHMTRMAQDDALANHQKFHALYHYALQLRGHLMPEHKFTVRTIMLPLLIATCLFSENHAVEMGFYYLREAVTGVQILRVDNVATMGLLHPFDRSQQERLYWLTFIHERYISLRYQWPAVLSRLERLPSPDPSMLEEMLNGFDQMITLFQIVDTDFLFHWLNRPSATMTLAWIQKKQSELGDDLEEWENQSKHISHLQQVDFVVTRHWLRTLVWQMALSKFFLTSSGSTDQIYMELVFPARISRRLRLVVASTPRQILDLHGSGILRKMFDITSTLADILEHVLIPSHDDRVTADHLDDFVFLYDFLLSMSKFDQVEKSVLESKYETLRQLLPVLPQPEAMLSPFH